MRALTPITHKSNNIEITIRNNEVLAREGIDTRCIWITPAKKLHCNNEVLAREGIDTSLKILNYGFNVV